MKYILRTLWLIGYIPVFIFECIIFITILFVYPLALGFYFIKTGSCENCPFIPPLKESEDERIRKALIDGFKRYDHGALFNRCLVRDIVSWLEKQGEHANFRNKIQIGDKVTRNEDGVLVNLSQLKRVAKKDEKQGEQEPVNKYEPMSLDEAIEHCKEKSCGNNACSLEHKQLGKWLTELKELKEQNTAWSEEDDALLYGVIETEQYMLDVVTGLKTFDVGNEQIESQCAKELEWLKTLKERIQPQNTWKPSEHELEVLKLVAEKDGTCLMGLYKQLKKLKEE